MKLFSLFTEMRQLDEGAKDRYRAMFGFVDLVPWNPVTGDNWKTNADAEMQTVFAQTRNSVESDIKYAVTNFSTAFIPWYLRWTRLYWVNQLQINISNRFAQYKRDVFASGLIGQARPDQGSIQARTTEYAEQIVAAMMTRLMTYEQKFMKDLMVRSEQASNGAILQNAKYCFQQRDQFKHFYDSDHIPGITQYSPEGKIPSEVITDLRVIERKYNQELSGLIRPEQHEGVPIVEFPDGSAWFDLEKSGCDIEAKAMGHCGNGVGRRGETVLSYRVPVKRGPKTYWSPHMTFILDTETGMLGEMKGRNNDKPVAKYHPQVIALLKSDLIKGIRGGGYKPENNFAISDLPLAEQDRLIQEKPELATSGYWIRKYGKNPQELPKEAIETIQRDYADANPFQRTKGERLPFFNPELKEWVLAAFKDPNDAISDLFGSDSEIHRIMNDLDAMGFDDWAFGNTSSDESREEALEEMPEPLLTKVKDHLGKYYATDWAEYIEDHGLDTPVVEDADNDDLVKFLDSINHPLYDALHSCASDALRYGTESEAYDAAKSFLNDIGESSRHEYRSISLHPDWDGDWKTYLTADNSTFASLFESLSVLEEEGWQEWLRLKKDVESPHYGWQGSPDWKTVWDDYGTDRVEEAIEQGTPKG